MRIVRGEKAIPDPEEELSFVGVLPSCSVVDRSVVM